MPRYRRHPAIVEAHRWFRNGDHPDDYARPLRYAERGHDMVYSPQHQRINDWEGQVVRRYCVPGSGNMHACSHCGHVMDEHGWIDVQPSGHIVCPGDWVISGAEGSYYPCKPDVFEATHWPAHVPADWEEQT